jgi:hypothetical protein
MAFLCVSQQGEFENTSHKKPFSCRLSPSNFLSRFRPKNTIKMLLEIRPENLKKSHKKVGK